MLDTGRGCSRFFVELDETRRPNSSSSRRGFAVRPTPLRNASISIRDPHGMWPSLARSPTARQSISVPLFLSCCSPSHRLCLPRFSRLGLTSRPLDLASFRPVVETKARKLRPIEPVGPLCSIYVHVAKEENKRKKEKKKRKKKTMKRIL